MVHRVASRNCVAADPQGANNRALSSPLAEHDNATAFSCPLVVIVMAAFARFTTCVVEAHLFIVNNRLIPAG